MKYNKLFLVSLVMLAIFMLGAVSATEEISVDNLTVEESTPDSIEKVSCDVELDDESSQVTDPILSANQQEDRVADKKPVSMNLSIVGQGEGPIFSVDESGFEIEIEADYYVKVDLSDKVNGTYSLYIDNKFIKNKEVTSTTNYLTLDDISRGKHVVKVEYSGNDEYQPVSSELSYHVISQKADIYYDAWVYGQTVYNVGVLGHYPTGDIVAIIDGKRYSAPLIRGEVFFELPELSKGSHKIHIDYSGDINHDPTSVDDEFDVYYEIFISNDLEFNKDTFVSLRLPNDAKGNLLVNVDGETVGNVALVNGYAKVSLNNFTEFGKEYDIYAEYTGTDYEVDYCEYSMCINYPNIQFEKEMIENQEYVFTFELPDSYSGNLTLEIPGYDNKISSKVTNGKASVRFIAKETGLIKCHYKDNSGYVNNFDETIFVRSNPNMVVAVETKAGQNPVFKVNVPNDAGGAISVLINGKEYISSYFTKTGSLEIPGLADGKYTAIVTYSGDYKYSTVSKTITFTKTSKSSKTKISLKLSKVTVKKSAKKLVIKATLKINGKVVKGKKITFKFNKKTYKAQTNKKGVAKVTIKKSVLKKLKVGKKVKYQASYGKTTVKQTVKVKK